MGVGEKMRMLDLIWVFVLCVVFVNFLPIGSIDCFDHHLVSCDYNPECCDGAECDGNYDEAYTLAYMVAPSCRMSMTYDQKVPIVFGIVVSLVLTFFILKIGDIIVGRIKK